MQSPAPSHASPGVVVEPPPAGLSSGRWTVTKTTLSIVGALVILAGAAYVVARARWARRA